MKHGQVAYLLSIIHPKHTLRHYSFFIGLFFLICSGIKILNTTRLCLAYQPSDVPEMPHENMYTNPWKQTIGYWDTNLNVGISYFRKPLQGLYLMFWQAYDETRSIFFNHYAHGATEVWGYLATICVHGALESTGILFMTLAGMLLWILIISVIYIVLTTIISRTSIPANRIKLLVIRFCRDLIILMLIGVILIIVAGPIEAYISWPRLLPAFTRKLWLSSMYLVFLLSFFVWIFFIKLGGYENMKRIGKHIKFQIHKSKA